jgi:acetyltransferase-like isoleucine patch superfamily enzyme
MRSPRTLVLRSTIRVLGYVGLTPFELTRRYARRLGVQVGGGTRIYDGVSFGSEPWLVRIGDGTVVTFGVQFVTHDGSISVINNGPFGIAQDEPVNHMDVVIVGENCFLGIGSILLPGTVIGDHAVVGAGSVVSGEVEPATVVAGNPARVVSSVAELAEKLQRKSLPFPTSWPDETTRRRVTSELVWGRRQG